MTTPRDDWFDDERGDDREIGWGDESLSEGEDSDIDRLLDDLPPHHLDR
ncbi:hypothetical protein [Frankia sp. AiPa1]|nr:hypothetical protein [Frankia sp. AiPa1]MCL9761064.1 hypothetical protein [Frankia sp. AiPa1]